MRKCTVVCSRYLGLGHYGITDVVPIEFDDGNLREYLKEHFDTVTIWAVLEGHPEEVEVD